MSADVDIPDKYTITLAGGVDMDLDNIHIMQIPTITLAPVSATLSGGLDMGLDNIRIKELPTIDMNLGVKPTRVHMPMNTHICLSLFGINLLKVSLCGENMMIAEPYVPHRAETRCF
ncbi:MAG: hypothetical protein ACU836_14875 [Gammaproteobacteria bacterium]